MRFPTLILSASLVGNGLLAAAYLSGRKEGSSGAEGIGLSNPDRGAEARPAQGAGVSRAAERVPMEGNHHDFLRSLFVSRDSEALARTLREAGLSEDLVRAIVREQIQAPYRSRIRAIEEGARGDRPWWQGGRVELTSEQRAEIRQLQRDMRAEMDRVLGDDRGRGDRDGLFSFLPAGKADAVRQINADYDDMTRDARDRIDGFRLPSDRDTQRLLEAERRADIAAILTPEELELFEMRTSNVGNRLRRELGNVIASEDEFREIYRLAAAFETEYSRDGGGQSMNRRERSEAESALRQQILEMLGPERAAQVAQQRDPDYRTMQAATQRLNLPPTATSTVMNARTNAAEQSQRIMSDTTLDAGQKRSALQALAAQVRGQLQQTMGPEGGDAFAQRAEWLRALERGSAFSLRPEGGVEVLRNRGGDG